MTTTTASTTTPPAPIASPNLLRDVRHLLTSEWIKFVSLRSNYAALLVTAIVVIGTSVADAYSTVSRWSSLGVHDRAAFDPVGTSLGGLAFAQFAVGVLGVLAISSEYTTGTIRATFIATPRRGAVLAAKTTVVAATSLVTGQLICLAAFLTGQAILHQQHLGVSLTQPDALRVIACSGYYVLVITLFGLGLGAILRHTAAAIAALVSLTLILDGIVQGLPTPWNTTIHPYLLSGAGLRIVTIHPHLPAPSLTTALLTCAAYPVAALLTGLVLTIRRDA
jgi:ABC-2 type transport system permease protein